MSRLLTMLRRTTLALAVTGLAMTSVRAQDTVNLEFTAGSPGGAWFTQVTGLSALLMSEYPGLSLRVVPGGGKDNASKIQAGISQLGMGLDFISRAALDGKEPYTEPHGKLTTMGSTGVVAQFMVYVAPTETRPLDEVLRDTKLRFGTLTAGTTENLTFMRALAFYGNSADNIRSNGGGITIASYNDLISAYHDGMIDVVWGAGEIPSGVAAQMTTGRLPSKLLSFPPDLIDHLTKNFGYGQSVIPAGTYPDLQTGDIKVSAADNIFLASADVPEDVIYKITKILIENRAKFPTIYAALANYNPETSAINTAIPLHPGAEKAFRELGFLK